MKSQRAEAPQNDSRSNLSISPAHNLGTPSLSLEDLKILRAPFPKESLGVKVQSFNKDRNRAMLVLYLQHTDVQDRLEEVDPSWTLKVLGEERLGDNFYVRMKLTLKGVARENVGEGNDPKGAHSDAIKRCAMLFGVGRYLYGFGIVWTDYNDSKDRYRHWTIEDYEKAIENPGKIRTALSPPIIASNESERPGLVTRTSVDAAPPADPQIKQRRGTRSRDQLNRTLMSLYRPYLTRFPDTKFVELLQNRYSVSETRLMSLEQLEDLLQFMENKLQSAAS